MSRPPLTVLALVLLSTLASAPARAEVAAPPSLTVEQMSALMHVYCEGERLSLIPFAGTGVATLATGGVMLASGNPMARGAAWPLLSVGAIELIAGIAFSARAGAHAEALDKLLHENPAEFAQAERHHLHLIRDRWQPALLIFEAALVATGGALAGAGAYRGSPTMQGVGFGLGVQGMAMFLLDWSVLDRARDYAAGLALFMPEPAGG